MITCTGWTWEYIDHHVTLPQVVALNEFWSHTPPVAIALKRISLYLGMDLPSVSKAATGPATRSIDDDLQEIAKGPLPIFEGRPNDPMLDLLDL